MTPVEELRDNPRGGDPDDTENDRLSPLTEGMIENGLFFFRTQVDCEQENDEIGVRTVNDIMSDLLLTSLAALIVTD